MSQKITRGYRTSFILAAALAMGTAVTCTYVVRAEDAKASDAKAVSAAESKAVKEQIHKMKTEAGEASHADGMKAHMAKMIVMEQMAVALSRDADFKEDATVLTHDANVTKLRDEAKTMAEDPEQMKKIEDEIVGDPKALREVIHHALMMEAIHEKLADKADKTDKSSLKDKLLDKVHEAKGDTK